MPLCCCPGVLAAAYAASPTQAYTAAPQEVTAQDAVAADISKEVETITTEFSEAYDAWVTKMRAATEEEREGLFKDRPDPDKAAAKLMALVNANPKAKGALDACSWVAGSTRGDMVNSAIAVMGEHYAADEAVADAVKSVRGSSDAHIAFFEAVLEKNANAEAQGYACYHLGLGLMESMEGAELSEDETKAMETRIEGLFGRLESEFGDVKGRRGAPLAETAAADLFEFQNLRIGKTAPEIVAEDVAGVEFKLSDYRGKVVMLDFWGDW